MGPGWAIERVEDVVLFAVDGRGDVWGRAELPTVEIRLSVDGILVED